MKNLFLLFLIVVLVSGCDFNPNTESIIDEDPKLIKSVPNGQKLVIGNLDDPDRNYLYIANLRGTPYQMGKAFGLLFQEQIKDQLIVFYSYYKDQLTEILLKAHLPAFVAQGISNSGESLLKHILDLNCRITKRYTNKRYLQELKGIGEGAKINSKQLARLNLFPQLIKAACTIAGVWNVATENQQTLHLRALDWDSNIPISKYPLITVYHPSNSSQHIHANFGWVGLIGSLTGMSDTVSIGEKVWYPKSGSVQMTRYGNPWTYVLRDVLYDADNIAQALAILSETHRTCAIHLGLGSSADHSFRMLEYAQKTLNVYDDNNYTNYSDAHPKKEGIAFFDKQVQPSNNPCVGKLLINSSMYGHWEMQSLWRVVGLSHETGDTQLVVFDEENKKALISYSKYNGNTKAFARRPIAVNLKELFAQF